MRTFYLRRFILAFAMLVSACHAQTTAGVTLSRGAIGVGEKIKGAISVDPAPSYAGRLELDFTGPDGYAVAALGELSKGQKTAIIESREIDDDAIPGTYRLTRIIFVKSRAVTLGLPDVPVTFEIETAETTTVPKNATVTLKFTLQQILRNSTLSLQSRTNKLSQQALVISTQAELQRLLASELVQADRDLLQTKVEYLAESSKEDKNVDIFFEDLHRNYLQAITQLREKEQAGPLTEVDQRKSKLLPIQLRTRPTRPSRPDSSPALPIPLVAQAAIALLNRNILAYRFLSTHGNPTFTLQIFSSPGDANIYFRRIGEPYELYSRRTNQPSAVFPLAKWTFKLERYGCTPQEQQVDPFIEADIRVDADLRCKR